MGKKLLEVRGIPIRSVGSPTRSNYSKTPEPAESGVDRAQPECCASRRGTEIWAMVLALHGEESPSARYTLEFVFAPFEEVDA
jgi:hypothetical protein